MSNHSRLKDEYNCPTNPGATIRLRTMLERFRRSRSQISVPYR
jgi:hypothetical protein